MKNICITGATSFIGVNLIRELLKKQYNIISIIRKNSNHKKRLLEFKEIKIIELNMDEIEELPSTIETKCDIFYHLAWNGTRGISREDKRTQEENYLYSIKTLKVAKKIGCKTFISAGSQAEYGLHNELVTEKTKEEPVTEYGIYKYKFYKYAKTYCKKNNIIFIEPRFFSLYGNGDFEKTLIISSIDKMLNNEEINLTECIQTWNFLNIKDAVNALVKLQLSKNSGIYNIGSNDTRILKDFIEEIYQITNSKSKINFGVIPYPDSGIVNVNPSISKLEKEIDWQPEIKFSEGIKKIIEERNKNEKD